jgi:hypothetical protein
MEMHARLVALNLLARSPDRGRAWFTRQPQDLQYWVLEQLVSMTSQAGAVPDDAGQLASLGIPGAERIAGMLRQPFEGFTERIREVAFGDGDPADRYSLVVAWMVLADDRRRAACGGSCQHWWHRDLSNLSVLADELFR